MDIAQGLELITYIMTPENILSFFGVFSIVAKFTPWEWDDNVVVKLENKPNFAKNVVNWTLKVIHIIGLSKK